MKLTPFGKLLLTVIGLALIAVAVWKYAPPGFLSRFGRSGPAAPQPAGAPTTPSAPAPGRTPPAAPPATAAPAAAPVSRTVGAALNAWIEVPAATFVSGPDGAHASTRAFVIQEHEVTNREYAQFLAACAVGSDCGPRELPPYWDDVGYLDTHLDHPVVFVSWGDANACARYLGARLPTATEWERAARGVDGRDYPTGNDLERDAYNILGPDRHDQKVKAPKQIATWAVTDPRYRRDRSAHGVLGMGGNVSEWTSSPSEAEPSLMVAAGGSWDSWDLTDARTYHRVPKPPTDRSSSLGFRCVKDRP